MSPLGLAINRRKSTFTALTVSVLCTLTLYAYSWSITPRDISIGEISQDEVGTLVRIQGYIKSITALNSGGIKILLIDYSDFSTILVFASLKIVDRISFLPQIVPGCQLRVVGEVQEYNGILEIVINDSAGLELLKHAEENIIELGILASNPETFRGMQVLVHGEIRNIVTIKDGDKVLISSDQHSLWVDTRMHYEIEGRVDVFGKLMYNDRRNRFEIVVVGGDDAILPHQANLRSGYTVVPLEELISTPGLWEGLMVAVLNVNAKKGELIGTSFELKDYFSMTMYSISCMMFGWDWSSNEQGIKEGMAIKFFGTWEYYSSKAQWQINSDEFTLWI